MRAAAILIILTLFCGTALADKPTISNGEPLPRVACNLESPPAHAWNFADGPQGFTLGPCDTGGIPAWMHGPTNDVPDAPAQVWATNISGAYLNDSGEALISPPFTVGAGSYLVEVYHYFDMENGFDGGNVKVDGLHLVEPMLGYPGVINSSTSYYAWCVDDELGWTGGSHDWRLDCFDLSAFWGQTIMLHFEFGSDISVQYPGWYIGYVHVGRPSNGFTYYVCPDGSGDFTEIQPAIDYAGNGDTILLCDGIYSGPGNWDLSFHGKGITVRSESGNPENCIIDCGGAHRGVSFDSFEGPDAVLAGVTIRNAASIRGSGLFIANSTPEVRNCIISGCTSDNEGAGALIWTAHPLIEGCRFVGNTAGTRGGGICAYEGSDFTVRNCVFDENLAVTGAGICCQDASMILQGCRLSRNEITSELGGGGGAWIENSSVSCGNNTLAANRGIAIVLLDSAINISHCIVAHTVEWAPGIGGEAMVCIGLNSVFVDCTDIFGNDGGPGCFAPYIGSDNNFAANPRFCGPTNPDDPYSLHISSPCAPGNTPGCGLIGASPVGCGEHPYLVCPDGSGHFTTIQAGIDAAYDGDVIELCDAVYTGPGNRDIEYRGKLLTVRSQNGNPNTCVIDCEGDFFDNHQGFIFDADTAPGSRLEGVTITGGFADRGAGIFCRDSAPIIENCILDYNFAWNEGAGLLCWSANPTIDGCYFVDNVSNSWNGGAICAYEGSSLKMMNTTLDSNEAVRGAGLYLLDSEADLDFCTIVNNLVTDELGGGGGIWSELSSLYMDHCTVSDNRAIGIVLNEGLAALGTTIIAFTDEWAPGIGGEAVLCIGFTALFADCCDVYGNDGGPGCLGAYIGTDHNFALDPIFCRAAHPTAPYTLHSSSPCWPHLHPDGPFVCCPDHAPCEVGAQPVGCPPAGAEGDEELPSALLLGTAAPNPLVTETSISFELPTAAHVTLCIYDASGRLVRTLLDASRNPGVHQVVWDGTDDGGQRVRNGVYFHEIVVGSERIAKRVVLLR